MAWDESIPREGKGYIVYGASKTESERAAFKWVKENDPPFVLNTILPGITVRHPHSYYEKFTNEKFAVWQDSCSGDTRFNTVVHREYP